MSLGSTPEMRRTRLIILAAGTTALVAVALSIARWPPAWDPYWRLLAIISIGVGVLGIRARAEAWRKLQVDQAFKEESDQSSS
jgi:hypothetical protein